MWEYWYDKSIPKSLGWEKYEKKKLKKVCHEEKEKFVAWNEFLTLTTGLDYSTHKAAKNMPGPFISTIRCSY